MIRKPVDLSAFKPEYPAPPRLHWIWIFIAPFGIWLLLGKFMLMHLWMGAQPSPVMIRWTSIFENLLITGWLFVQIFWFRSVNSKSKALWIYGAAVLFGIILTMCGVPYIPTSDAPDFSHFTRDWLLMMADGALFVWAVFKFRSELHKHYNQEEPIGLYLGGGMTFLFHIYYFQYHFRKIALLKEAAAATPAHPIA